MKAIKCDLCGKEIDSEAICMFPRYQIKKRLMSFTVKSIVFDYVGRKHKSSLDVCDGCWGEFEKFVELKKLKEN